MNTSYILYIQETTEPRDYDNSLSKGACNNLNNKTKQLYTMIHHRE